MEAHGHEEIGKEVTNFIKKIIREKFPIIYKQIYINPDTGKENKNDEVRNAFYLGNWLADNSQLFAPDTIFSFKMNNGIKIEKINNYIDTFFDSFCEESNYIGIELQKAIYVASNLAYEASKNIQKTEEQIEKLYNKSIDDLKKMGNESINALVKDLGVKLPKVDLSEIPKQVTKKLRKVEEDSKENQKARDEFIKESQAKGQQFSTSVQNRLETSVRSFIDNIKFSDEIIQALKSNDSVSKNDFVYDNRMEIWETILIVLKLNGYKKFVKGEGEMDFDNFKTIFDNYIETNSSIQRKESNEKKLDRFRFKLNQYYPSDHLDRAFDEKKLNKDFNKCGKLYHYLDDEINYDTSSYRYFEDYIHIIAEKLTTLNVEWIIPTFYQNPTLKPIVKNSSNILIPEDVIATSEFYLNFSRLGQTLHVVEDFFAHSNFLELAVTNLDALMHPEFPRINFFSQKEYLNKLQPDELKRYLYTMFKSGKLNERGEFIFPNDPEENLITGSFAEGDMAHSLYHLAFGWAEKELHSNDYAKILDLELEYLYPSIIENQEDYVNTDKIDTLTYFYTEFLKIIQLDKDDDFYKFFNKKEEYFSKYVFEYIFIETTKLRDSDKDRKWDKVNFDDNEVEYLRELFNRIIKIVEKIILLKDGIDTLEALYASTDTLRELMKLILAFLCIFIPGVGVRAVKFLIMSLVKNIVIELLGETVYLEIRKFLNEAVARFFTKALEGMGTFVETHLLGTFEKVRRGSHSILAKDEEYKNKHFNKKAIETAIFADKVVVLALLTENHETENGSLYSIDIHKLLKGLLSHPLRDKSLNNLDKFYIENSLIGLVEEKYNAELTIPMIFERIKADNYHLNIEDLKQMLIKHNLCLSLEDFSGKTTIKEAYQRLNLEPSNEKNNENDLVNQPLDNFGGYYNLQNSILPIDNNQMYKLNVPFSTYKNITTKTENRYHWIINFFNKKDEDKSNDYGYDVIDLFKDKFEGFVNGFYPKFLVKAEEVEKYSTLVEFFNYYNLGEPQIDFIETKDMLDYYINKENSIEFKVKRAHELFMEAYIKKMNPGKEEK